MTEQRQVYSQPTRNAEELRDRNVRPIPNGHVWDGADHIGWIENGDVFSTATKQKIATLDQEGNLYAPDGKSLNLSRERRRTHWSGRSFPRSREVQESR